MSTNAVELLRAVELVPVLELEPFSFATGQRTSPSGTGPEMPAAWSQYWHDSLADSRVVGLTPIRPGSWHVATRHLTCPSTLGRILDVFLRSWGGVETLSDPDSRPVFNGGLALFAEERLLVEPGCCADLGDLSEWRTAYEYRQPDWKMVWIGHPWVSVRFENGRRLLSEPHELNSPVARWAVDPGELSRAVSAAERELTFFSRRVRLLLGDRRLANADELAQMLSGLSSPA